MKKFLTKSAIQLAAACGILLIGMLLLAGIGVVGKHTKDVSAQGVAAMKQIEESVKPSPKTTP